MISAPIIDAEDGALAAAQAAAADDHGGDDVELGADGHGRIALAQARHLHHAGQAEEQAGQAVDRRPSGGRSAMPQARAAASFEPMANTRRPKTVWRSTSVISDGQHAA